jgi:hypothetical protein
MPNQNVRKWQDVDQKIGEYMLLLSKGRVQPAHIADQLRGFHPTMASFALTVSIDDGLVAAIGADFF